jgi:O-acetylserine/cysteine efflux transporter
MRPRDMALACLVSVVWGLAFVAIPFGLKSFSPPQLTALRFAVAALPALFLPRPRVSWSMLLLIGLTLFTGQFLLLFFAYTHGLPAGVASVTQQMQAFFTVLLAALFLLDVPGKTPIIGLIVAFCGLGLIGLTVGADLTGVSLALALGAAFSWAVGNVLVKRLGPIPMLPLMAWLSLVPPLPSLLVSRLLNPAGASLVSAVAHAFLASLLAVIYIGAIATTFAYAIWGSLLARYPTAVVAPFALLAPCTGILASTLIFGERFDATRYAGMAFIVIGLAFVVLPGAGIAFKSSRKGTA